MAVRRFRALLLLGAIFLFAACQKKQLTESEGRAELLRLHQGAKAGSAQEAVTYGERALALMTQVDLKAIPAAQERDVAGDFPSESEIAELRESEDIIEAGEQAFIFEAFDESLRIFQMAYDKDPTNEKANAYLASLAPLKYLKGVDWRMSSLDEDWMIKQSVLTVLRTPEKKRTMDQQWELFTKTPYKKRFKYKSQFIEEVVKPVTSVLINKLSHWDYLASINNLDVRLKLNHVLRIMPYTRFRHEDALAARTACIGIALYLRLWSLYDVTALPTHTEMKQPELWALLTKNPSFGLITDPEFYPLFKNRVTDVTLGMDYAATMLKGRHETNSNSPADAIQYTTEHIISCDPLLPRHIPGTEGYYYDYWVNCKSPKEYTLSPALTMFLDMKTRWAFSDMKYRYTEENKRASAWSWYQDLLKQRQPMSDYEKDMWNDYFQVEKVSSAVTDQNLHQDFSLLRKLMNGPEQVTMYCVTEKNIPVYKKVPKRYLRWVDFPKYLSSPINDLKDIRPQFYKDGDLWTIADPTIRGLFPEGYPCLKGIIFKIAESGLLFGPRRFHEGK